MADGPDFLSLFQRLILQPNHRRQEIISYLRFFKGTDKYEDYAKHYVPLLPEEDRKEFLDDLDKDAKKQVKEDAKANETTETVVVEVTADTSEPVSEESSVVIEEKPKKKRGRKPKSSPSK